MKHIFLRFSFQKKSIECSIFYCSWQAICVRFLQAIFVYTFNHRAETTLFHIFDKCKKVIQFPVIEHWEKIFNGFMDTIMTWMQLKTFWSAYGYFQKRGKDATYIYSNGDDTSNSKSLSWLWLWVFALKVFIHHFLSLLPTMSTHWFYILPQWLLWIELVWIRHHLFLSWVSVIRIFC